MNIPVMTIFFISLCHVALAVNGGPQNEMTVQDTLYNTLPKDINHIEMPNKMQKEMADNLFRNADTDGNHKLSKEEFKSKLLHLIEVLFNSFDHNDDGFLDVSDSEKLKVTALNPILEEIFSVTGPFNLQPTTNKIVLKIDGDKDGKVSKAELTTFIDGVMKKIDINDDKLIDTSEIAKAMEDMGLGEANQINTSIENTMKSGNVLWKSILEIIDNNNDGKVDKEELIKVLEMPSSNLMAKGREVMQAFQQFQQATEGMTQGQGPTAQINLDKEGLPEKAEQWILTTGDNSGGFKSTVNLPVLGAMVLFAWRGLR